MMAALIIRSLAKSYARDRECNMLTYFPETLGAGGVEKSTDVRPHNGGGPGGVGKIQSEPHALRLKSPATKSTS